ncbi:MAG: ABC transporter permease [Faecalibacterium sp.]|jgi:putative ABC transport system permease protein|nr:ABC transporter permease [Faecalibacterium sp.]
MIAVKNKKAIANLARKSLEANRARNVIAVCAIALTTLLFTALFTVAGTLADSLQQQTFRQAGGDFYGSFKDLTAQQCTELAADARIVKSGARQILGIPQDAPFTKTHAEVSYMDATCAAGYFCTPQHGRLPAEGTNEIACDTRFLELLGITPQIGAKVTVEYTLGTGAGSGKTVEDTFTLSGWWEFDEAGQASMAIVPRSYAAQVMEGYTPADESDDTGLWTLNVYLKSTAHIESDLAAILADHGYQNADAQQENYIDTGVNWAYLGAQLSSRADGGTVAGIAALLALIVLTGYLIIYNIFQISVANDIRFYGLLKTIGTTGRQLRRILRRQALTLCAAGIPIGLALGWLVGKMLSPSVLSTMNTDQATQTSANPMIFFGAAVFAVMTVLLSCAKPARLAGRVSPIEAVRWTEGEAAKTAKTFRRAHAVTPLRIALANLARSKKKTVLVVVSLSLAVVLLEITCTFAGGFDMDKYLGSFTASDFILGSADYFHNAGGANVPLTEDSIAAVQAQGGVTADGRVYGTEGIEAQVPEAFYRTYQSHWNSEETIDTMVNDAQRGKDGNIISNVQLYGMEDAPLSRVQLLDGSLDALRDPKQNVIAAVYGTDDYGQPEWNTNWAKVGDSVTVRYVEEWEFQNAVTGERIDDPTETDEAYRIVDTKYREVTYTVAAVIAVPNAMSYRYMIGAQFVLGSEAFCRDTGTQDVMTYVFDTEDTAEAGMARFLANYTEKIAPELDYESKESKAAEFEGIRMMFLTLGGALSAVIGLVGVLNFFNAVLTSILSRKRELAMLQSVGMTGRQLKAMLIWEGELYALYAAAVSLMLCVAIGPLLKSVISGFAWFFTYRLTLWPVLFMIPLFLLLGAALPLGVYRVLEKQTIVERLRGAE